VDDATGLGGRTLRTVSVNGGPATTLVSGGDLLGYPVGSEDGWIYFGAPERNEPRRVPDGGVAGALANALEKLPADRFETAREFAGALANPTFGPVSPPRGPR
jgi:hypothetical protein